MQAMNEDGYSELGIEIESTLREEDWAFLYDDTRELGRMFDCFPTLGEGLTFADAREVISRVEKGIHDLEVRVPIISYDLGGTFQASIHASIASNRGK